MSELSIADQAKAARNDSYGTFELRNAETGESRTFEIKNLSYDSYIEFCELARPILMVLSSGLDVDTSSGEFKMQFNPMSLDYGEIVRIAGKELPRMAWLCCKQSDPKITIDQVKHLGHRPQALLSVVLKQIKHNELVKEFSDFFPQLVEQLTELLPAAKEAAAPIPTTQPTE